MKPKVKVLRGLPGSGKSKYARDMSINANAKIVSADDFFYRSGVYQFDPRDIGEAHSLCFYNFLAALGMLKFEADPVDLVIVDNTNLSKWEISPYVLAAHAHGVTDIEIVTIACDPELAFARQKHGVPRVTFDRMFATLESEALLTFWRHTIVYTETCAACNGERGNPIRSGYGLDAGWTACGLCNGRGIVTTHA